MAVKPLSSVQRALRVLETISINQPISLAELSVLLGEDKSALQRVLVTLSSAGWVRPTGGRVKSWEITEQPLIVANHARRRSSLVARLRPFLESLRDSTGESASVAVANERGIVTVDVAESPLLVRASPRLGSVAPAERSAAGLAVCAHLEAIAVADFLGSPIGPELRNEIERTRQRGWSLNAGAIDPFASSLGAAVLDSSGHPVAALVVSAPSERLPKARYGEVADLLTDAARRASEPNADGSWPARSHPGAATERRQGVS